MNILDFFDGDITSTIQRALDSGQPTLHLPAGTYTITRPLKIHSNTALALDKDACLVAGENVMTKRGDFLLTNADTEAGGENIIVTGGVWDGNYRANPKSDIFDENGYSGALLNFVNVKNLTLRGLRLQNSAGYFICLARLNGFTVENIALSHESNLANNDGVHMGGHCENGVIRHIHCLTRGTTRDDLIAFNADDCVVRTENRDLPRGPIRNVLVEDVYAEQCHCLVRLLSVTAEISGVTIRNLRGGCRSNVINMDAARYCRTPLIAPDAPAYVNGVGNIHDVIIENMSVNQIGQNPLIMAETNARNLVIRNFERTGGPGDGGETIRLRNISPSRVILRGAGNDADLKTDHGDVFTLPQGGFEYFSIDTEDMT